MKPVIKVENISKMYDLGLVGTGTLSKDLNRMWARMRGKTDPYATLAELNDRTKKSKSDTVWALKDINFEVEQGEVLGIIGKNGAGKSTLLKILSQITSPTTGEIKIKGRVASLLEVGTGMHPEMTARQNIYLNGAIMGMTRREVSAKLDEIVDFAGVGKYIDTPIKRFSSGMTVRLGFAVAAFLEPEILIVDEVLAVVDEEFQKKAVGKMQDVSKGEGRTVLFVSHNMASVQSLCNKSIVLETGQVAKEGSVQEGINFYLSSNTEGNIASLKNRKDRKGTGEIKFSKWTCWVGNNYSNVPTHGVTGSVFNFRVFFDIRENIHDIIFSLTFYSRQSKAFYTTLKSDCVNKKFSFSNDKKKGFITFSFDRFPFTQGEYIFDIMARNQHEPIDWIRDAGIISISNGDYYGNGILPARGRQGVLFDFNIEHNGQ